MVDPVFTSQEFEGLSLPQKPSLKREKLTMEQSITKLTTRQWKLYDFIKYVSIIEQRPTTIEEICKKFPQSEARKRDGYSFKDAEGNHSNCASVYKDINTINKYVEKSIITDHNHIRLATEEEQRQEWERYIARGLKWLAKGYLLKRKAACNGQGKLIGCNGDPIEEKSQAREFYESFIDELIKETTTQNESLPTE